MTMIPWHTRLKKRLPAGTQPLQATAPAFLELLINPPARGPVEYVAELESAGGRMRIATKGAVLDCARRSSGSA